MSSPILFEKLEHVAVFTLNRPDAMNAVNLQLAAAFTQALDEFERDDNLWVGVVKSSHPKVFCAGADLKSVSKGDAVMTAKGGFAGVVSYPRSKPLIACVDGQALAGGFEIALSCDLIVASKQSAFGLPEVKRSLIAMAGGTYRLPKRIPRNVAMELLLVGDTFSAERAHQLGLVNRLTEPGASWAGALQLAEQICANAPLAVRETRNLVVEASALNQTEAQQRERAEGAILVLMGTDDFREGPRAFIEKRPPRWSGKQAPQPQGKL